MDLQKTVFKCFPQCLRSQSLLFLLIKIKSPQMRATFFRSAIQLKAICLFFFTVKFLTGSENTMYFFCDFWTSSKKSYFTNCLTFKNLTFAFSRQMVKKRSKNFRAGNFKYVNRTPRYLILARRVCGKVKSNFPKYLHSQLFVQYMVKANLFCKSLQFKNAH